MPLAAQMPTPPSLPVLLETGTITGDARDGLTRSCLVVYSGGRYRRESRREKGNHDRPQHSWELPDVFEGKLPDKDMETLRALVTAPEFRAITGTIGKVPPVLVFGHFDFFPREGFEILTVGISGTAGQQVFEINDRSEARRQAPLRAFLDWIKQTDRLPATRLSAFEANNCSLLSPAPRSVINTGADMPTHFVPPNPINSPPPQRPPNQIKAQSIQVRLVINADGTVAEVSIEGRTTPEVAQAVLDATRKWTFEPARFLGLAVAAAMHLTVEF